MGLDISIIRTDMDMDLGQLYTIRNAVVDGMDWYLGNDKSLRMENHLRLRKKALLLNKEKVLEEVDVQDSTRQFLSGIDRNQFSDYLSMVVESISEFTSSDNTHLSFDFNLLPGVNVLDSCSWYLKDIFDRCAKDGSRYPDGDFIVELDPQKISDENARWRKKGWQMNLAKVTGWFSPVVGSRIAIDCAKDLGVEDSFVEPRELLYYRNEIEKVARTANESNDRLWLVSSY